MTKLNLCAKSSRESSRLNYSGKSVHSVVVQEEIGDGLVKVGKITFDTGQVLGKGCEGTFVYKYVIHLQYIIYIYIQKDYFLSIYLSLSIILKFSFVYSKRMSLSVRAFFFVQR